jgi:outer membrane protein assembly factor BamB
VRIPRFLPLALVAGALLAGPLTPAAQAEEAWTTYHRDAARSGLDPNASEPIPPKLAWESPGLGAPIYGQPLVFGGRIYVATVGDEIYALDANTGAIEWQKSAGTPVPSIPGGSDALPCGDIEPTVGIVSTPVIDPATGTIYVVADTWNAGTKEARHMLEGFNLETQERVLDTPVDPPGVDPTTLLQRSALNLDDGNIVFGFGGNFGSCSGALAPLVAVPENGDPARFWQTHFHDSSALTTAGGMWATSGAAVDGSGNIFAATANPVPPSTITDYDYSDSVVELTLGDFVSSPTEEPLAQAGFFEPPDWEFISNEDLDLGSSGGELLPGGLFFAAGKTGTGYLINEATMGSGAPAVFSHEVCKGHGSFGGDSYADGTLYIPCTNGVQALAYNGANCTFTPLWQGPSDAFGSPIVSGGLVWVVATGGFKGGGEKLYGLDPSTGESVYTLPLPAVADHFASPSAAGGRLFVSTGSSVTSYMIANPSAGGGVPEPPAGPPCAPAPPQGPGGAGPSATGGPATGETPNVSSAPPLQSAAGLLRRTKLHAGARGRVSLALRCTPSTARCRGTVVLRAKLNVTRGQGRHRAQHVMLEPLAKSPFGPAGGDFSVNMHLGAKARALLHKHHGRLRIEVLISSPGTSTRMVEATLS